MTRFLFGMTLSVILFGMVAIGWSQKARLLNEMEQKAAPIQADGRDGAFVDKEKAKKGDAKPVSIPKKEIYTSGPEGGFKERLRAEWQRGEKGELDKPVHKYTDNLAQIEKRHGPRNMFLVRGFDVTEAIKTTRVIYVSGWSGDPPPDTGQNYWLVVYLGTSQSGPCKWTFKSCTVKGNLIEFVYKTYEDPPEGTIHPNDLKQYFFWVPLPELDKGSYELKLVDEKRGTKLIRYVEP